MQETFKVNAELGGINYIVYGWQEDNYVDSVTKVEIKLDNEKYEEVKKINYDDFKDFYEDQINEAIENYWEELKVQLEDIRYDAWKEEQFCKHAEVEAALEGEKYV